MAEFSGIVRISSVSDFIEPSQKCVIPLSGSISNAQSPGNLVGIHSKMKNDDSKPDTKVKVTLSDCLACSGCITTAETMLVESQTIEQMLKGFQSSKISVVTISPQSLTSLAVHFNIDPTRMAIKLSIFFKSFGVRYVMDSSFARILSRRLSYQEFKRVLPNFTNASRRQILFTGICPGFVCYAEKTHGELLVPRLSRVRSPQALTALLVKDYLGRKLNVSSSSIFHVSIMPCYDKKLEASRSDFISADGTHEVDCVVTPSELVKLISSDEYREKFLLLSADCSSPDDDSSNWLYRFGAGHVIGDASRESSGGYADFVARRLLHDFPGASLTKVQRSKDLEEFHVSAPDFGDDPVVVAKMYGFRNVQNAVQKMKRNKLRVDFGEVMACPAGCSNGGGQVRGESAADRARITVAVNDAYETLQPDVAVETELEKVLAEWKQLNPTYESMLYTDYHALPPKSTIVSALGEAW